MSFDWLPAFRPHTRYQRDLSAFVDGALSPARAAAVEGHAERCDGCRAELAALRSLKADFAAIAGTVRPTRTFHLSPAMVAAAAPARVAPAPGFALRAAQLTAAVGALAFAGVLGADLMRGGESGQQASPAYSQGAAGAAQESRPQIASAASAANDTSMSAAGAAASPAPRPPAALDSRSAPGSPNAGEGSASKAAPAAANDPHQAAGVTSSVPAPAAAGENDTGWRVAEVALGVVVVGAGGVAAFSGVRRRRAS